MVSLVCRPIPATSPKSNQYFCGAPFSILVSKYAQRVINKMSNAFIVMRLNMARKAVEVRIVNAASPCANLRPPRLRAMHAANNTVTAPASAGITFKPKRLSKKSILLRNVSNATMGGLST